MARPSYEPNKKDRDFVEALSIAGCFNQDQIAAFVGLSIPTLRKYYAKELEVKDASVIALATSVIVSLLKDKDSRVRMATAMFVMKTRARWRETGEAPDAGDDLPEFEVSEHVPERIAKKEQS